MVRYRRFQMVLAGDCLLQTIPNEALQTFVRAECRQKQLDNL